MTMAATISHSCKWFCEFFASNFLFSVEVDIVLPEEMPLRTAHNIGETLQRKIERLDQVERAFVHVDYEFCHAASDEHKYVTS